MLASRPRLQFWARRKSGLSCRAPRLPNLVPHSNEDDYEQHGADADSASKTLEPAPAIGQPFRQILSAPLDQQVSENTSADDYENDADPNGAVGAAAAIVGTEMDGLPPNATGAEKRECRRHKNCRKEHLPGREQVAEVSGSCARCSRYNTTWH